MNADDFDIPESWKIYPKGRRGEGVKVPRYLLEDGLPVTDAEIVRMHIRENLSATEIGKRIGASYFEVRTRLVSVGMYDKGKRPLRRTLNVKHIKLLYERGYSPNEIGDIVGASGNTIRRHLRRARVILRKVNSVWYVKEKIKNGIISEDELKKFSKYKEEGE